MKRFEQDTAEFIRDFCLPDGSIDWGKLVQFVSEEKSPKPRRKKVIYDR